MPRLDPNVVQDHSWWRAVQHLDKLHKVQGFPLTPATGGPEATRSVEDPELPVNSPVPNVESCFSNIGSVA